MAKRVVALNPQQKRFCKEYVKNGGNGFQAALAAGYKNNSASGSSVTANRLLKREAVQKEIARLLKREEDEAIADAKEVMKYFTKVMRGEVQDQFGLDAPLSERTRAAQELAKRTVDIENKINGKPDSVVQIVLDWGMPSEADNEDTHEAEEPETETAELDL